MAETKSSYPMLPGAHWWILREKFKQSIPGVVTDTYLAAALNMQVKSARVNILPYLKDIGLIDQDGKTQELAKAWRDDQQYSNVCKQIRERIYPEDLLAAVPNPAENRESAERWFGNQTGAGKSAVQRMTQFYIILADADVSKKPESKTQKTKVVKQDQLKSNSNPPKKSPPEKKSTIDHVPPVTPPQGSSLSAPTLPGININLEIHISSDATADQIDKIFESMSKHIYKK